MERPARSTDLNDEAGQDLARGERVCADLQSQMQHAREMVEQSRRLFRAACTEPRSFRRDE